MKLIVSTCGTSIFTNNSSPEIREILNKYTNYSYDEIHGIPEKDRETIDEHISRKAQEIDQTNDLQEISRMSAELNGIIRIYNNQIPNPQNKNNQDFHFLVHSDTYLGTKAAEIVENWLRRRFNQVQSCSIRNLRTDTIENFRAAVTELVKFCYETIKGYRERRYHVIFNLTGGFKSVQGIMQTLGMFYADECVYIFETGNELLRIPKLPIKLEVEDTIRNNLTQFRKLSLGQTLNRQECNNIPETFLFFVDDKVTLNEWGELAWREVKDKIYSEKLLDSPSERIRYSEQFVRDVNNLPANRKKEINERIDQLYQYIVSNGMQNPDSLSFHQLQGNHVGSTHEFYAWSDGAAKRIYCHYEDNVIVIDRLGEHL
jgi:putative CRISPR-associated protein (TIGR02619 family)